MASDSIDLARSRQIALWLAIGCGRTENRWRPRHSLFYLGAGLPHVVPYVFPWTMEQTGDVIDATCHLWRIQDIREATVGVFIFTMLFTAILAALQLPSPGNERTAASAIRDRRHDP